MPTKCRELLVCEHGVTSRKTSIIIVNVAVKLEYRLLACFVVFTVCVVTRSSPLGTVRPLYRTGVSLLYRKRFLYI